MSCNCKKGSSILKDSLESNEKIKINGQTILTYTLKTFGFLLMLLALPILNIYIIWLMFNILVLNKNVDFKPLLSSIGSKFMEKEDDENDEEFLGDEFDNLTEEDVILLDSDEITSVEKK
jgi:hypothetical protein